MRCNVLDHDNPRFEARVCYDDRDIDRLYKERCLSHYLITKSKDQQTLTRDPKVLSTVMTFPLISVMEMFDDPITLAF